MSYDDRPTPNLPLLRKVLDQIDAEPDSWAQAAWGVHWDSLTGEIMATLTGRAVAGMSCGTAHCIAGHAAVLSGYIPTAWDTGEASTVWQDGEGRLCQVGLIAQNLLGLTWFEAELLFNPDNDRKGVQRHAERIAARAGERL